MSWCSTFHQAGLLSLPRTVKSFGNQCISQGMSYSKRIHCSLLSLGAVQLVCTTGLGFEGRGTVQKAAKGPLDSTGIKIRQKAGSQERGRAHSLLKSMGLFCFVLFF